MLEMTWELLPEAEGELSIYNSFIILQYSVLTEDGDLIFSIDDQKLNTGKSEQLQDGNWFVNDR